MAESSIIACPECSKKFKGKGNLEGKKIKCPYCDKAFVVPARPGAPVAAPPPRADDDEDGDPNPYGLTYLDIAPRCPNCANKMESEDAFICLFCGYNTLTRELGKTEKIIGLTAGEKFIHVLPGLAAVLAIVLLIIWQVYYSLLLPQILSEGWANFFGHESLKMWHTLITLAILWPLGFFAYKRLIVHPLPKEQKID